MWRSSALAWPEGLAWPGGGLTLEIFEDAEDDRNLHAVTEDLLPFLLCVRVYTLYIRGFTENNARGYRGCF